VSKLFNLKQWLPLEDAARHLSIVFGEVVTVPDVLRLGLDGRLRLSVRFVNLARVKSGNLVGPEGVVYGEFTAEQAEAFPHIPEESKGRPIAYVKSLQVDDERFLNLDETVTTVSGVWDLPMFGSERHAVEQEYQDLTGGPEVTLFRLSGTFVAGTDGRTCRIQESLKRKESRFKSPAYYPAMDLPDDSEIVIRTEALPYILHIDRRV
jgi:hypothetical protein